MHLWCCRWCACTQGVCHRDLKLENTLLDGRPAPRLKICDFGYSKVGASGAALLMHGSGWAAAHRWNVALGPSMSILLMLLLSPCRTALEPARSPAVRGVRLAAQVDSRHAGVHCAGGAVAKAGACCAHATVHALPCSRFIICVDRSRPVHAACLRGDAHLSPAPALPCSMMARLRMCGAAA